MANRIRDVYVVNHRLDPHETELRIHVELDEWTPTTEIKGRLMGPRCAYRSTVEIAYPMRPVGQTLLSAQTLPHVELRVIIPEACWWEPKTPFLYQGPLELWQDGEMCARREISHGIRWVQSTPNGLKLNGKPLILRGRCVTPPCTAEEARAWHDAGINAVLTPPWKLRMDPDLWRVADRAGLFVIERTQAPSHFMYYRNETNDRASVLGWVLDSNLLEAVIGCLDRRPHQENNLFGVPMTSAPLPAHVSFVLCSERENSSLPDVQVPKLVLVDRLPDPLPTRAEVIGWIESDS